MNVRHLFTLDNAPEPDTLHLRSAIEYKAVYEGNFNNVPIPVKDCSSGKRMDEAIVKALGWRIARWEDETDGGYEVLDANGKHVGPWGGDDPKFHWSPSTDIKAAWKLIESIAESEDFYITKILRNGGWEANFKALGAEWISADADTAPLAISRAFLLSRGIQEI